MSRRAVALHQLRLVRDRVARPVVASVDGISQVTGDPLVTSHPHHLSSVPRLHPNVLTYPPRPVTLRSGEYVRTYSPHVGTKVPSPGCHPGEGDRIPPERTSDATGHYPA